MSRKNKKKHVRSKAAVAEAKSVAASRPKHAWVDNLLFAGILLILFLRPFLSGRTYPHYNQIFHIGVAIMAVLWFVKCYRTGTLELHNRLLTGFILVFVCVCSLTFFTSVNRGMTLRYVYEIISYTLLFLIIANNFRDANSIKMAVAAILVSALLVNCYGLFQRYYTLEMTRRAVEEAIRSGNEDMLMGIPLGAGILHRLESVRVFSTFLYPNAYAMFLGIAGALTLGWFLSMRRSMKRFALLSVKNALGREAIPRELSARAVKFFYGSITALLSGVAALLAPPLYEKSDPWILISWTNLIIIAVCMFMGHMIGWGVGSVLAKSPKARRFTSYALSFLKGIGGVLLLLLFVISCILIPWNLWLTYSRGGWGSAFIIVFIFLVAGFLKKKGPRAGMTMAVVGLVILGTILANTDAISAEKLVIPEREVSFSDRLQEKIGLVQRVTYWKAALGMIRDNPWLGIGWGAFEKAYPRYMILGGYPVKLAHNDYLQVWAETGIVGLNAFVGLWLVFLYSFWRKMRSAATGELRGIACGLGAGVIGFLAHGLIDFDLYLPALAYYLFALLGLLVAVPTGEEAVDRFSIRLPKPGAIILIIVMCLFIWSLWNSFMGKRILIQVESIRNKAFPTRYAVDRGFKTDLQKQKDMLAASISLLKESINCFPLDSEAYHMLGDTYLRLAQVENRPYLLKESTAFLEEAARLDPMSPYVFQSLATAYWVTGNQTKKTEMFHRALEAEKKASENFPVNPEFYYKVAQIYKALGMKKEARAKKKEGRPLRKHYKEF